MCKTSRICTYFISRGLEYEQAAVPIRVSFWGAHLVHRFALSALPGVIYLNKVPCSKGDLVQALEALEIRPGCILLSGALKTGAVVARKVREEVKTSPFFNVLDGNDIV